MNQLFAQAKKLQEKVMKAQKELESMEVVGIGGSDAVTITMTGSGKIKSIKLNPNFVNSDDTELLEDLILVAYNNAREKADKLSAETLPIPTNLQLDALG